MAQALFSSRDLTIFGAETDSVHTPGIDVDDYGLKSYLIMLFHDQVLVEMDGRRVNCGPGSLIIYSPGTRRCYGNPADAWRHSWLNIGGRWLQRQLSECRLPLNRPFLPPDPAASERHLLGLCREVKFHQKPDGVILRNLLQNWFRDLMRILADEDAPALPSDMVLVDRFIEANFSRRLTLKMLADTANLSISRFSDRFRHFHGVSPVQYVIRRKLLHAAWLLREGNMNVTQAAREVGYENVSSFADLFKKHFGVSPVQMRRGAKKIPAAAGRKLRMEHALILAREGRLSVEEIAAETGYVDATTFRTAFEAYFGHSAEQIRAAWQQRRDNRSLD